MIDSLLRTRNATDPQIDLAWAELAARRLTQLHSGAALPLPAAEVFALIKERFPK